MAGLTLAQAEARLASWLRADEALETGQTIKINNRLLTKTDAAEVRNNIDYWQKKCQELSQTETGRGRTRTVSPNW